MKQGAHGRGLAVALGVAAAFMAGPVPAAHADVTATSGSAYGFFSNVSLFGGPFNARGPSPQVTLPPGGSATPITATAPTGSATYGPATIFSSGPLTASTQGTIGPAGSVTTSSSIQNVNTSGQEVFTASSVDSTCTASESGVTASTTIVGGTLRTSEGDPNVEGDDTVVAIPTNPAPNYTVDGTIESVGDNFRYVFNEQIVNPDGSITVHAAHQYLLGPTAVGELIIGKSECGVTATPDTTPPGAPVLSGTSPASPADDNTPQVLGSAENGAEIRIYLNDATCSDPADASGTAAELAGAGIAVSVPENAVTEIRARAEDAAGNVSQCSSVITYREDSIAPSAPTLTGTNPPSPANDNNPFVQGTITDSNDTIKLYLDDPTCAGPADATGTATELASAGIQISVPDDSTTEIRATGLDAAGNASPCSDPIEYVEESDVTAPDAPVLTGTDPASPANDNTPDVVGTAEPGSTISLYLNAQCIGPPAATGPASQLETPGIEVTVAEDSLTQITATATDASNNKSSCSDPIDYVEDSTAPETQIDSGPNEGETIAQASPTFAFSSNEGESSFECRLDAGAFEACTSPEQVVSLDDGQHTFSVRAVDPAGNTDGSEATRTFTVDATPPTVTINKVKVNHAKRKAKVLFSGQDAGGSLTFACKLDNKPFASCASPKVFKRLKPRKHRVRVRATDEAGNTGVAGKRFRVKRV